MATCVNSLLLFNLVESVRVAERVRCIATGLKGLTRLELHEVALAGSRTYSQWAKECNATGVLA